MAGVTITKTEYGGWENCIQVRNDSAELIITSDVGPRIIRYGLVGQVNELCEIQSTLGRTGGGEWRLYGGHRLWHGPEDIIRTYEPDNDPVRWEEMECGIKTIQKTEKTTGIEKQMEISLSPDTTRVCLLHRIVNKGPSPVALSAWSITAMTTGGEEIIPLAGADSGLLPNRVMAIWPYARMNDSRLTLGERYIILRQDPGQPRPFKIGTSNEQGWAAYVNHNHMFVKYYTHQVNADYPDFGVSFETYTNDVMLELETLSPLTLIEPGASIEHKEQWELFDNVHLDTKDEDAIDRLRESKIGSLK